MTRNQMTMIPFMLEGRTLPQPTGYCVRSENSLFETFARRHERRENKAKIFEKAEFTQSETFARQLIGFLRGMI